MILIPRAQVFTLTAGVSFATPAALSLFTKSGAGTIEVSNDGSTWSTITPDANSNFVSAAPFIRSTGADSIVIAKAITGSAGGGSGGGGALVDIPRTPLFGMVQGAIGTATFNNYNLNASGDRAAFVVQCTRAGELDSFEFRVGTVTNTPDNGMRLSFQTVDPATGFPDTVVDQFRDITGVFSSNTWQIPPGPLTSDGTNGGTKRTVAVGEYVACVIDFVSFVALDSIGISVFDSLSNNAPNTYCVDGQTGAYIKSTSEMPVLALKYADGVYQTFTENCWPLLAINSTAFNSGSTPDERSRLIVPSKAYRVVGAFFRGIIGGALDLIVYNDADGVLGTVSLDPDLKGNVGQGTNYGWFTPFNISAGATYRVAVKPTTVTNVTVLNFDVNSNGLLAAFPSGITSFASNRTDGGAWSSVNTNWPAIGLVVDQA